MNNKYYKITKKILLHQNLIYVHALDLVGFQNNFGDGKWKPTKGLLMVVRGVVYSTLYKTQVKLIKDGLNAVDNVVFPDLWHKRLAHPSEKDCKFLQGSPLFHLAKVLS